MENDKTIVKGECCALVATLQAAALEPRKLDAATFLMMPPGYREVDITDKIEAAAPAPYRKTGSVQVASVPSLVQYLKDQAKIAEAYVYADLEARTITGVLNDQRAAGTGWRDHRVTFKAEHTPEWRLWTEHNKRPFKQAEFAEFIEDNIADLSGEEGTKLLEVATTIAAKTGITFASAKRLQDGQTQLTYNEVIDATAGAQGELKIPQTFKLGVRIFKNGEAYAITARLKYRIGSGQVMFFYELERPERAVEDAFNGYVETVRTDSTYTVLLGKA
ncbi:MAG: DUF2303 family protein [Pseudomonadota bacterium]